MSRRTFALVLAAAALALAGLRFAALRSEQAAAELGKAEQRFRVERADLPAPASAMVLEDGSSTSLEALRGQVLFVNFWATWCPPCVEEMPSMLALGRELTAKYPGRFRMVAVSVDEGWEEVRKFFGGKLPPELLVTRDPDYVATKAFYCGARGNCPDSFKFPETYLVDRRGRVTGYVVGPRDWSDPAARRIVERMIAE